MKQTRYQDSNLLVKIWRRRHFIYVPFRFILAKLRNKEGFKNKTLWSLLIGSAQCDMNWTYTSREVNQFIRDKSTKRNK